MEKVDNILDLPITELNEVPVHILAEEELRRVYEYNGDYLGRGVKGVFIKSYAPPEYPTPCIILLDSTPMDEQIFYFFHEYGHYICHKNNCHCYGSKAEEHAWNHSMKLMMKYGHFLSLILALDCLNKYNTYRKVPQICKDTYDTVVAGEAYNEAKNWVELQSVA